MCESRFADIRKTLLSGKPTLRPGGWASVLVYCRDRRFSGPTARDGAQTS